MKDWNHIIKKDWTLFLDRDGVINRRIIGGYVTRWEEFEFLSGVLDAMKVFSQHFKYIVLVTNQQGVGKELMTEDDLDAVHDAMMQEIEANDGRIDLILSCTQLASDPDNFRKPKPDMAFMAQEIFPDIDLAKSLMIGDGQSDIDFGRNAGMCTVFIGDENSRADDCVSSLYEFSKSLNP